MKNEENPTYGRRKATHCVPAVIFLWALSFPSLAVQAAQVTETVLRDAILGKVPVDVATMDLNKDGKVDGADLVKLVQPPKATFQSSGSEVSEGDGTIKIKVKFDKLFRGYLRFEASGTAKPGVDYEPFGNTIPVNGTSIEIPVKLIDNLKPAGQRTIVVRLLSDIFVPPTYTSGVPQDHTVRIDDNDAVWQGGLEIAGFVMGFKMTITRNASTNKAFVESDGHDGFPTGRWPAVLTVTADSFKAVIPNVLNKIEETELDTVFKRKITLTAKKSIKGHIVDMNGMISGNMTDTFNPESAERQHLRMTIKGKFNLAKEPITVPTE